MHSSAFPPHEDTRPIGAAPNTFVPPESPLSILYDADKLFEHVYVMKITLLRKPDENNVAMRRNDIASRGGALVSILQTGGSKVSPEELELLKARAQELLTDIDTLRNNLGIFVASISAIKTAMAAEGPAM